jgi:hypothetical protein
MGAPIALASLYSKPAIIGSVVTLLLVLSLYALFRAISFDFLSYSHRKVIINKLLVTALPILTIIILRVTFLITKEIPNEERSIIVHGVEIHHAVTGTILMLLMNIAATRMRQPPGIMFNALLGIIAGLVLDQVMYLPLIEVTDSAYNGIMSWIGAIAGVILFACAGIAFRHSRSYRPDGL